MDAQFIAMLREAARKAEALLRAAPDDDSPQRADLQRAVDHARAELAQWDEDAELERRMAAFRARNWGVGGLERILLAFKQA